MLKFAEQYLFRTNPYTGKRYPDEPALFAVLLTNENDITFHHGAAFSDKTNPVHSKLFQALARRIAATAICRCLQSGDFVAAGHREDRAQ